MSKWFMFYMFTQKYITWCSVVRLVSKGKNQSVLYNAKLPSEELREPSAPCMPHTSHKHMKWDMWVIETGKGGHERQQNTSSRRGEIKRSGTKTESLLTTT